MTFSTLDSNVRFGNKIHISPKWSFIYVDDFQCNVQYNNTIVGVFFDLPKEVETVRDVLMHHINSSFLPCMEGRYNDIKLLVHNTGVDISILIEKDWQTFTLFVNPLHVVV